MAFYEQVWYCNAGDQSTTGHYAVTKRPQNAAVAAGVIRRQFTAPTVGNERCFVCIVAGTTANTTDATWTVSRGAKVTDGTVTWQECTGIGAVNGDLTNTFTWAQAKAVGAFPEQGTIIKRNNGASYQICSTTGFAAHGASEPAFSDTAGVTTNDNGNTFTSLGPVANFSAGGAPHARLGSVFGSQWFAAGNTVYVGDNHAESQTAGLSISPPGSITTIGKILCHNHSGSYPPASGDLTTGATISTTAAANINLFGPAGAIYFAGIAFKCGVGAASGLLIIAASGSWMGFDACSFEIASSGASTGSASVQVGQGTSGYVAFNNTRVKFANAGQGMILNNNQFVWQNTGQVLVSGSTVPTNFLNVNSNQLAAATLEALDLSQLTGTLVTTAGSALQFGQVLIKDCKLNASATPANMAGLGLTVQLVRCDSSGTAYKSARYQYEGAETTETSITRVGGAVDPTSQAQSRKIVSTVNAQWLRPFKMEPYAIWNATTGANVTVTVYGTINSASLPINDDIWLEAEYLGSAATPLGTIATTTKATLLALNAAVASDGSSWNGGGSGAGWSPFKLTTTLSSPQPGLAGYIEARIRVAKASATYYIDPKPVLS